VQLKSSAISVLVKGQQCHAWQVNIKGHKDVCKERFQEKGKIKS
jgi:hypothetical protein